jgi:hypothetical protein
MYVIKEEYVYILGNEETTLKSIHLRNGRVKTLIGEKTQYFNNKQQLLALEGLTIASVPLFLNEDRFVLLIVIDGNYALLLNHSNAVTAETQFTFYDIYHHHIIDVMLEVTNRDKSYLSPHALYLYKQNNLIHQLIFQDSQILFYGRSWDANPKKKVERDENTTLIESVLAYERLDVLERSNDCLVSRLQMANEYYLFTRTIHLYYETVDSQIAVTQLLNLKSFY